MSDQEKKDATTTGDGVAAALTALASELREDRREARDDRRRDRRRGWFRFAFFALLIGAAVISSAVARVATTATPHIARVEITGTIASDTARQELLARLAREDAVKAVIVRIDSPGGTTVGGETLYGALRSIAEKKPVVAVTGELAASAAYMAALGADRIYARGNTITASIGVIFTAPNFHGALETLGVRVLEVKSGARKAEPSPFQPPEPEKLEAEKKLIDEIFEWFVALVKERRDPPAATMALIRDGRVVTGRRALELGLVDAIGGERDAVSWLVAERGVTSGLPVRDRKPKRPDQGLASRFVGAAVDRVFGVEAADRLETSLRGRVALSILR